MSVNDDLGDTAALLEGAHLALERIPLDPTFDFTFASAVKDLDAAVVYAHKKAQNLINWKREREK